MLEHGPPTPMPGAPLGPMRSSFPAAAPVDEGENPDPPTLSELPALPESAPIALSSDPLAVTELWSMGTCPEDSEVSVVFPPQCAPAQARTEAMRVRLSTCLMCNSPSNHLARQLPRLSRKTA